MARAKSSALLGTCAIPPRPTWPSSWPGSSRGSPGPPAAASAPDLARGRRGLLRRGAVARTVPRRPDGFVGALSRLGRPGGCASCRSTGVPNREAMATPRAERLARVLPCSLLTDLGASSRPRAQRPASQQTWRRFAAGQLRRGRPVYALVPVARTLLDVAPIVVLPWDKRSGTADLRGVADRSRGVRGPVHRGRLPASASESDAFATGIESVRGAAGVAVVVEKTGASKSRHAARRGGGALVQPARPVARSRRPDIRLRRSHGFEQC